MNALDQIAKAASRTGWHLQKFEDIGSRLSLRYAKNGRYLLIQYRLFGGMGGRRLCRYYDIDDGRWINWGIEIAHIKTAIEIENGAQSWTTEHVFTGKNKKSQVLTYLRRSADGHEDD